MFSPDLRSKSYFEIKIKVKIGLKLINKQWQIYVYGNIYFSLIDLYLCLQNLEKISKRVR